MGTWYEVGAETDFPAGAKACKSAGTTPVVVCNVGGTLRAIQNMCPHAGLPLGEGDLTGKVITCPFHGYAFDVETGKNVDFADDVPVRTYPVRAQDGRVEVELPD